VDEIGEAAVTAGYTIVSGLARGIDAIAHTAALDAHGSTVAVLGCGADYIYPPENRHLFFRLVEHGLILSEYPFGVPPSGDQLRKRNKVIVALADAVLVAECPIRSGAMIAARAALQQRKPLLAFEASPGTDPMRSAGTSKLITEGLALPISDGDIKAIERAVATYTPVTDAERRFVTAFVEPGVSVRVPTAKAARANSHPARKAGVRQIVLDSLMSAETPSATAEGENGLSSSERAGALIPILSDSQPAPLAEPSAESDGPPSSTTEPSIPTYRVGERVRHGRYGDGKIVAVRDKGTDQEITIAFQRIGKKQFMASLVSIERV